MSKSRHSPHPIRPLSGVFVPAGAKKGQNLAISLRSGLAKVSNLGKLPAAFVKPRK
jgi:hypothetical protein